MGRGQILRAVCGLLVSAVLFCACGDRASKLTSANHDHTNVLWITVCTLRSDHLGAYGYSKPVSPKLDDLAKRSFLFERTLTQAPWTRPSIASMVTSIYPRSLLIDGFGSKNKELGLNDSFQTAAEYFHDAGYYTIGITANPNTNPSRNFDQGYDFYVGTQKLWKTGYGRDKADARAVSAQLLDHLNGPAKGRKFFAHLVLVDGYDEQIRFMDEMLARLFANLNEMGLSDTLIVFNANHGEGFGEAGGGWRSWENAVQFCAVGSIHSLPSELRIPRASHLRASRIG